MIENYFHFHFVILEKKIIFANQFMDKYKDYSISFLGLKNGKHHFEFVIHQKFFDLFEAEKDFTNANLVSHVLLEKHSTFLEFKVSVSGDIDLICDISNKNFSHNIKHKINFLVKFGEEYNDSNEEIITIPHHYHEFNIAQIIYEAVVLSIPMKKLSPEILENNEYQILIDKYSPKIEEEKNEIDEIDPRWAALNKLKK